MSLGSLKSCSSVNRDLGSLRVALGEGEDAGSRGTGVEGEEGFLEIIRNCP